MLLKFRSLIAVAMWAAGIAMLIGPTAAADPTVVLEIKVKQVVFYESADGRAAGRIARDEIELPLGIKDISPNGLFLVTIGGKDLWIPKMLTRTDEVISVGGASCQKITDSYGTSRGFGDCN